MTATSTTTRILTGGDPLPVIAPHIFTSVAGAARSALVWGVDLRNVKDERKGLKSLDRTVRGLENLMCTIPDVTRLFVLIETRRGTRLRVVQRATGRLALRTTEAVRRRTGSSLEVIIIDVTGCTEPEILRGTLTYALEHHVSNGAYPDIACHWRELQGRTLCQLVQERHS